MTASNKLAGLDNEQISFTVQAMETYIAILEQEGHRPPATPDPCHSSLLRWLLEGNEPLPKPPPCLMSRPRHDLATGSVIKLMDPPIRTLIAQNERWKWEDIRIGLVRHLPSDTLYRWDEKENTIQLASNE